MLCLPLLVHGVGAIYTSYEYNSNSFGFVGNPILFVIDNCVTKPL